MARPKKRRGDFCKDCVYLKVRRDRDGRASYWCIVHKEGVGPGVMWKKACRDFAGTSAAYDRKREIP